MRSLWAVIGRGCIDGVFYGNLKDSISYDAAATPRLPTGRDLKLLQEHLRDSGIKEAVNLHLTRHEVWLINRFFGEAPSKALDNLQDLWGRETPFRDNYHLLAAIGLCSIDQDYRGELVTECMRGEAEALTFLTGQVDYRPRFEVTDSQSKEIRELTTKITGTAAEISLKELEEAAWVQPNPTPILGRCSDGYVISEKDSYWPWWNETVLAQKLHHIKTKVLTEEGYVLFEQLLSIDSNRKDFPESVEIFSQDFIFTT